MILKELFICSNYLNVLESFLSQNLEMQYSYFYASLQLAKFTILAATKTNGCWFTTKHQAEQLRKQPVFETDGLPTNIGTHQIHTDYKTWNRMTYDATNTVSVALCLSVMACHSNAILLAGRPLLHKAWTLAQHHQCYLGASWKCRIPEILNHDM